jgi:hypothetical protein
MWAGVGTGAILSIAGVVAGSQGWPWTYPVAGACLAAFLVLLFVPGRRRRKAAEADGAEGQDEAGEGAP